MQPPEGLRPVVAVVVRENGRVLICQRPAHKRHGGLWEFPGGKVHDGELFAEAARREVAEELQVLPSWIGDVQASIPDEGSGFVIHFLEATLDGEPQVTEHQALAWVTPEELGAYSLAPSDAAFAKRFC